MSDVLEELCTVELNCGEIFDGSKLYVTDHWVVLHLNNEIIRFPASSVKMTTEPKNLTK